MQNRPAEDRRIFKYLLILTSFFLLLEVSLFIQCNKAYLSDFNYITDSINVPLVILPDIFYFFAAQVLVHLFFCFIVWFAAREVCDFFKISNSNYFYLSLLIWFLAIITVLTANHIYFPNSKFSELTMFLLFNPQLAHLLFYTVLTIDLFIVVCVFLNFIKTNKYALKMVFLFSLVIIILYSMSFHRSSLDHRIIKQPNVILVGIDSLRPDFTSYFGYEKNTPFIDTFLKESSVFSEAITPLARTYPSWTSILTGLYPKQTEIRYDLSTKKFPINESLSFLLKQKGYETIYATDETRFSNIDEHFGFDKIVTPPMGLNDFLLGTFNDFPISNLVVNTTIGRWLFPYSYANRPVFVTYQPNSFIKKVEPYLNKDRDRPLFLAIHFCLAHFPYIWSDLPAQDLSGAERYVASIKRVDQQFKDFYKVLEKSGILNNAIVVLFSDHGEGLELPGDRVTDKDLYVKTQKTDSYPIFYPPTLDSEEVNQSRGHGTDVLGLSQYHTLLAFRLYGEDQNRETLAGIVSLLDIKPTILSLLKLPTTSSNGHSLSNLIRNKNALSQEKYHLFLESDYTPEAMRTIYPEIPKVMHEGIQLFQIDPQTTRLTVKDTMGEKIIKSKQYADVYDNWILALYPQKKELYMPILINLKTGEWTNKLDSPYAKNSPAQMMLTQIKTFFGTEIKQLIH